MRAHAVYLAVVALLVLLLVYASARAVKAHRMQAALEARFGLGTRALAGPPRAGPLRAKGADLLAPRTYEDYKGEVDEAIRRAQAMGEFGTPSQLASACGHALVGGKRLRAVITLEVARAAAVRAAADEVRARQRKPAAPVDAMEAALFIEYVHAAALVVDDLPCFDNDTTRRGAPSLHAAFGPAVAQLAALTLVAAAYQNICRQVDWIRANCPEAPNADRTGMLICAEASRALGAMGAAGGQYMDISDAATLETEYGARAVEDITYRKTATFFEIATVAGWLAGGGDPSRLEDLREVGRLVGTAFQIADDLGDVEADAARALGGKPGWNFAGVYGRKVAARELERNLNGARLLLTQAGLWGPLWERDLYPRVRAMAVPPAAPAAAPPTGTGAAGLTPGEQAGLTPGGQAAPRPAPEPSAPAETPPAGTGEQRQVARLLVRTEAFSTGDGQPVFASWSGVCGAGE